VFLILGRFTMNFKMKALVAAAVVATTMSGAANALTNNEIFLVANDTTAGVTKTFIAALGQAGTTQAFSGTSNLLVDYSADANWTSFIAGTSNVTYQVLGLFQSDLTRVGSLNAGDKLLVSSLATPGKLTNNQLTTLVGAGVTSSASFGGFEALNAAVTGTSTGLVVGAGANGIGAVSNNVFNQYLNVNTQATLGQSLNFYSVTRSANTSGLTAQVVNQYMGENPTTVADTWKLSATGQLTYATAAVPEADSWAMAMLGLGLMGFVARRRTRA
jgi:hypothetical protein